MSKDSGSNTKKTDDVRAQVIASLLAGQGVNETARQYDISKATVSRIKSSIPEQMEHVETQKREAIGDLLATYIQESLTTCIEQQKHFRDKRWMERQPADQMAVLHGVTVDKTVRLLEAAERAGIEG